MIKNIAYHHIADLIYRGSLFLQADIAGYSFIFKSINPNEFSHIRAKAGLDTKIDFNVKFNALYLAYSVYMIEDENILLNREKNIPILLDFFKSLPVMVYKKILKEVSALKNEIQDTFEFLEGFCYTDQSRHAWKMIDKKGDICKDCNTGIFGMESYGLNSFQENWISINNFLDDEDKYNMEFSLAVLIASATNPKGSKKLRTQHEADRKIAQEKRKDLAKSGFKPKSTWKEDGWAASVDTAEELVAELERQMQGLKDKHDHFIEDYLTGLQDESDKQAQEVERKRQESIKKHENEPSIMVEQRALSKQEAEALFAKRGSNNLVMVESDEVASPEQTERFYKKIGNKVLTPKG